MLTVSNYIVEVTRRCNMLCPHCMRGAAQRLTMSDKVIAELFQSVNYISTISFTGGEPTLAVPVIKKVVDALRICRVSVGSFLVVSNGKTSRRSAKNLAATLLDLYAMCDDMDGISALAISGDAYHDPYVKAPAIYQGLSFFQKEPHGPQSDEAVISTGRARLNALGYREPKVLGPFEVEMFREDEMLVEEIYVAANGNVVSDCDASYHEIDRAARGNILREPLIEIVKRDLQVTAAEVAA